MSILSAGGSRLFALLALATAACGGARPAAFVDVRQHIEPAGSPGVDVRLRLQPEHGRMESRFAAAVTNTLKLNSEWLGSIPPPSLTIVDPPWHMPAGLLDDQAIVLDRTPWWSGATSMAPELAVARALSRRAWASAIPTADLPPWFVRGLVELSARRAVVPLFQSENLPPGYAFLELRFFSGFVPRFVRIRLLEETDGDPLPAYRARQTANPTRPSPSPEDARSLEAKTVLALETLERWVGRPVFDQVIAQFIREGRSGRATLADFQRVASEVAGQDLKWFFDEAFAASRIFDYGVAGIASEPGPGGTFLTTVVARRYGDALFTGSTAEPVGGFEAGRGVAVLVRFSDGQQRIDYWDGRAREKTFRYRSPSRAVSAIVDPDRTMLLDLARTNNSRTLEPQAGTAASIWSARYMIWLEDLLLTYASLG
jgi:hypothetical protein